MTPFAFCLLALAFVALVCAIIYKQERDDYSKPLTKSQLREYIQAQYKDTKVRVTMKGHVIELKEGEWDKEDLHYY